MRNNLIGKFKNIIKINKGGKSSSSEDEGAKPINKIKATPVIEKKPEKNLQKPESKIQQKKESEKREKRKFKIKLPSISFVEYRILLIIIGVSILGVILLAGTMYIQNKNNLSSTNSEKLELIKNQTLDLLSSNYELIEEIPLFIANSPLEDYDIKSLQFADSLTGLDKNYNLLKTSGISYDINDMKELLYNVFFDEPLVFSDYIIEDNIGYQYLFYKTIDNAGELFYIIFRINNNVLNYSLTNYKDIGIDIYNSNFGLAASNNKEVDKFPNLNELSKKIYEGTSKTEFFDRNLNSYGFLDLGKTALYVNVFKSESLVFADIRRTILFAGFIFVLILILGLFAGLSEIGLRRRKKESEILLQRVNKRGKNKKEIISRIDEINSSIEKIVDDNELRELMVELDELKDILNRWFNGKAEELYLHL